MELFLTIKSMVMRFYVFQMATILLDSGKEDSFPGKLSNIPKVQMIGVFMNIKMEPQKGLLWQAKALLLFVTHYNKRHISNVFWNRYIQHARNILLKETYRKRFKPFRRRKYESRSKIYSIMFSLLAFFCLFSCFYYLDFPKDSSINCLLIINRNPHLHKKILIFFQLTLMVGSMVTLKTEDLMVLVLYAILNIKVIEESSR